MIAAMVARLMTRIGIVLALSGFLADVAGASDGARFGPQAAESAPDRRQVWAIPAPAPVTAAQALLFRPPGAGPFPLAVIAHASVQNPLRRAELPQPDYPQLAAALVARGFAVLVPERPGHGATGGAYLEDQGGCADADYLAAGRATADAIRHAFDFLRAQPFIRKEGGIIVGHSAGGWGALALAAAPPPGLVRIVLFSPGRGGHAGDRPQRVCAEERLLDAATTFGRGARVPVIWLVAANDSYFPPPLSQRLAAGFHDGGGKVVFHLLPAFAAEGHALAERGGAADIATALELALGNAFTRARPRQERQ
jgi:dienelactone hydrolase